MATIKTREKVAIAIWADWFCIFSALRRRAVCVWSWSTSPMYTFKLDVW